MIKIGRDTERKNSYGKKFVCTTDFPLVKTKYGTLHGYKMDDIFIFHGIRYAKAKWYQKPEEPDSWEGVPDALTYGHVSPYNPYAGSPEVSLPLRYWPMNENCQYLNVWTPSIESSSKKPVLFWIHGGGYGAGSSMEQMHFNGENLSRFGDCVVVTINHRLNILGYLDVSVLGEEYKNSGNVGNADIVAALKWVRDNIAQFGGDPNNVTIFGQSGGGAKIQNLMHSPSADGLYHKAIIQSGVFHGTNLLSMSQGDGRPLLEALCKELKLENSKDITTVPYYELSHAYDKVVPELKSKGYYVGGTPMVNDWMGEDFTSYAKSIPVMVGSVFAEFTVARAIHGKNLLSKEEVYKKLHDCLGDKTDQVLDLFAKTYPEKILPIFLLWIQLFAWRLSILLKSLQRIPLPMCIHFCLTMSLRILVDILRNIMRNCLLFFVILGWFPCIMSRELQRS